MRFFSHTRLKILTSEALTPNFTYFAWFFLFYFFYNISFLKNGDNLFVYIFVWLLTVFSDLCSDKKKSSL